MAVNKRAQRAASTVRPDPAPFQTLVDNGIAEVGAVLDAYEVVVGRWIANDGTFEPGVDIVQQERPSIDADEPPTLDALLVVRSRARMWAPGENDTNAHH